VPVGESAPPPQAPTITQAQLQTEYGAAATRFPVNTPQIACAWEVEGVEAGTEIVGAWVAADTAGATAPNYKIDEAKLTLAGPTSGTFTLSKSMEEWPMGSYRVEIFLSGKLVKTVPFLIG
jgi:hypothetical protein